MNPADLLEALGTIGDAPEGIERLRQLVLQLAVRGRLVPQDPDDEPAERQLARVANYDPVDRRSPKGTIELPDDLPYLPFGWQYAPLADIVSVLNGRAYKKPELLDSGTPVLRVGNLFTSKDWYYSDLDLEPEKYCDEGDLLFAWSASFGPFIWSGPKVIYHYHIWKLEPHCNTELDRHYLKLFLQNETERIKASGHGLAMIHMTKAKMERLPIPLPPLAEQRRIVAKVDELMALLDELERIRDERDARRAALRDSALAALQNAEDAEAVQAAWSRIATNLADCITDPADIAPLRQTILQLAVRGRLVPQDPEDEPASELLKKIEQEKAELVRAKKIRKSTPTVAVDSDRLPFPAPDGWIWASFSAVAAIASNLVNPVEHLTASHVAPDNIQKATGRLLPYRTIREDGVTSNKHRFRAGQILYSKIRPNLAKAVVVDFAGLCSADMYPIESLIDTTYLHRYLLSSTFLDEVTKGDNRLAMPKVNQDQLNGTPVPVPPLAEQRRIVAKVDELMAICDELDQRLNEAKAHKFAFAAAAVHHLQFDQKNDSKQLAASK